MEDFLTIILSLVFLYFLGKLFRFLLSNDFLTKFFDFKNYGNYFKGIELWLERNWIKLLVIGFLLGTLGSQPYSYYQMLKWIVSGSGFYFSYLAYNDKNKIWTWIFGVTAFLFNPIFPFYFSKDTWQSVDFLAAIIFSVSLFSKTKTFKE